MSDTESEGSTTEDFEDDFDLESDHAIDFDSDDYERFADYVEGMEFPHREELQAPSPVGSAVAFGNQVHDVPVPPPFDPRQAKRQFRFTWNNPTESPERLLERLRSIPHFKYTVFQREIGANGTPHFQGFVMFSQPKRFNTLHALLPQDIWLLSAEASAQANIDYCTKEDTRVEGPWEDGEKPAASKKSQFKSVCEDLAAGRTTLSEIRRNHPSVWALHYRGLKDLALSDPGPTVRDVQVILHIGPTGTGKTWDAVHASNDYAIKSSGQWYDSYLGQEVLIWDDFCGRMSQCKLDHLLRVTDIYQVLCEHKGGSVYLRLKTWYFTTNIHPERWYDWTDRWENYPALCRRFSKIVVYDRDGVKTTLLRGSDEWKNFLHVPNYPNFP